MSLRSTDEGVLQIGLDYLQMISAIVSDPAVHPVGLPVFDSSSFNYVCLL